MSLTVVVVDIGSKAEDMGKGAGKQRVALGNFLDAELIQILTLTFVTQQLGGMQVRW